MPHMSDYRSAESRLKLARLRAKERYGEVTPEEEEHLQQVHSSQRGDIPLGRTSRMRKSIQNLTETFRPFSKRR